MKKIFLMAAACAFALTACQNRESGHSHAHEDEHEHSEAHAHEHEHSHEHEHELAAEHAHEHADHSHDHAAAEHPLQVTVYSDSWEIFAEIDPLAAGEHSHIIAHVTNLADFSPAIEGEVTATLSVGDHHDSQTLHFHGHDAGMLNFSLTPHIAGKAELSFSYMGREAKVNVNVYADKHEAEHAAIHAFATSSNGVNFPKEQSWKLDFATEEARLESFGQVIKATGLILPNQAEQQHIVAKASGIIRFDQPTLPGMDIKPGQALMKIRTTGLTESNMDVQYVSAKAEYERAADEYARKQKLAESNIISRSELNSAKAEYESTKAVFESIDKSYSEDGFEVSSEVQGYITDVFVNNGEFVQTGQELAVVSSSRNLIIQAKVQPRWHRALRNISGANFKFSDDPQTYSLEDLGGKVLSVAKSSSPSSPLLPVSFEIRNSSRLLPGSFADIYIKTISSSETLTIANGAIVEEMGNHFVYKQLTPELFEKTQVVTGATDGQRTEIVSGLKAGDRVVSRGAIIVKLAQAAGGLDAHSGHVH